MSSRQIGQVETFVKETMAKAGTALLGTAHDYNHVDRVRNLALRIAEGEGFKRFDLVEMAALLHDIGFAYTSEAERHQHGPVGAQMADEHLAKAELVTDDEREMIVRAVRYHSAPPFVMAELIPGFLKVDLGERAFVSRLSDADAILHILQEADNLDELGAVGIMRAFISKSHQPDYDPSSIKGEIWGISAQQFDGRRAKGWHMSKYITDQINMQIAFSDNLRTPTARQIARPMVEFMKTFLIQLEGDVIQGRRLR